MQRNSALPGEMCPGGYETSLVEIDLELENSTPLPPPDDTVLRRRHFLRSLVISLITLAYLAAPSRC